MGIIVTPLLLIMAGPLAPLLLISALFPGKFTYELGNFAVEVMHFFRITIPEFLGISLF